MATNSINIISGLNIPSQIPLNPKQNIINESSLVDLGLNDNLAYTYEKGLIIYCQEEGTRYEWREVLLGEELTGLRSVDFVYPNGLISNNVDYSNKKYNFFKIGSPDGSETKLNASSNITISGNGTTLSPYVISSSYIDTDTTYIAGTGLSLVGTTFNNTSPDRIVTLTQGDAITITGTYPNFTISSTDTNTIADGSETKINAGTNINISGNGTTLTPYIITSTSDDISQYTDTLAQNAIGSILSDSSTIDFIYDDITPSITGNIINNSITSSLLANDINISKFINDLNYVDSSTLDTRDTNNRNRINHTGTQLSSTISDFTQQVRIDAVEDQLINGVTNIAPSQNVVFNNLILRATKSTLINTTSPLLGGGDLSTNRTLSIQQSNTSQSGYLSNTDWNIFNNKQSNLGFTPENISNKQNSLTVDGTGFKYPTVDAISGGTLYKRTISQIRSFTGTLPNKNLYTTDLGQEGNWYYDASDTTTSDNTGTVLVTADGKRIKRIFTDYVFPEWFGAVGDGVTNDSFAMESANNTGYDIFLQSGKSYLTPGFTPRSNINVLGKGKAVVSAIEGGFKQTNFYNDISQRISFGDEYLNYWLGKVITGTSKIIFSGDSTTAGATLPGNEALPYIFNRLLTYDGIEGVTVVNSGQSGKNTEEWNTTYLDSDMSQNPDIYIIRWGINDLSRGVLAFNTSLREGLQKIREVYSKNLTNISIILMTPNSISNSSNDNDEEWVRSIIPYIRQAARDYNCTYIDTYSLLSDSRSGKDIYFDNIGVHPKFQYNNLIASYIYDKIIPTNIRILGSSSKVWNESTSTRIATVSDAPNSYKKGISINRTDSSFPYDGFTITSKPLGSGAGTVQTVYSYASSSDYASRTSLNGSVWNAWVYSSMSARYNNLLLGDITATRITNLDVLDSNKLTASNGNATIRSTDTAAIDKGGYLTLGGSYNGTSRTVFAGIAGRKENAINNNIAGYLSFVTSDGTLGLTEKMRLFSNGGLNLGGATNPGAGILQANSYTGGATLTGTPTAPTATAGTNTTQIANTAFVKLAAKRKQYITFPISQVLTASTLWYAFNGGNTTNIYTTQLATTTATPTDQFASYNKQNLSLLNYSNCKVTNAFVHWESNTEPAPAMDIAIQVKRVNGTPFNKIVARQTFTATSGYVGTAFNSANLDLTTDILPLDQIRLFINNGNLGNSFWMGEVTLELTEN